MIVGLMNSAQQCTLSGKSWNDCKKKQNKTQNARFWNTKHLIQTHTKSLITQIVYFGISKRDVQIQIASLSENYQIYQKKTKVSNHAMLYLKKENETISWKLWNFELLNFLFQKFCIIKRKIVTLSMGWSWELGVGSLQMEMSQAS